MYNYICQYDYLLSITLDCCCVHIRHVDDNPQDKHNLTSKNNHCACHAPLFNALTLTIA